MTLRKVFCGLSAGLLSVAVLAGDPPGYRVVEKDGEKLYCSTRVATGSRVKKQTTCLTQAEMDELLDRTKDFIRNNARPVPPPQEYFKRPTS